MKKRDAKIQDLMRAIALIQNADEGLRFFTDLCTPAELDAMADRWQVVPLLQAKIPYRSIYEQTGVSVATITRIARCIQFGSGGYTFMSELLGHTYKEDD